MPRLQKSRGYSTQPQQAAKPDYGNPITKGLVSLANFGVAHPLGRAWDAVTNTPWGQTGTTGYASTNKGRGLLLSGNGSLTNLGFTPSAKITGPWTVFMLVASSASGTAVVCSPATQAAPYCACFSGVWSISNTANGSVSANGTMQAVAFRQFATTADVTVNGVKGTANAQNYAAWASGVGYLADFGSGGGFPLNGKMTLCAIFNRALSDYEIQKLTANPWQLFRAPASSLERAISIVNQVFNDSVAEAGAAVDTPNRDGGANYNVTQAEAGTASDAPSAVSVLAASIAEAMSGSDAPSVPNAVPVVTLKQDWLKNYLTSTQAALRSGQGYTNPMTIAAGSAIIALWAGWDATRQIPIPTINTGGPLANFTDAGSTASSLHPNQMTQAMAGVANVAGGSYTVTPPNIVDPDSTGVNGEVEVWMLEVTNLGTSFTVVDVNAAHRNNTSSSWSISTDSSPQVGDLVLVMGTMENNNAVVSSGLAGPSGAAGFTQIYLNDDGTNFIPTQLAYKVLTAGGTVTATWTATDPGKTEDFGMIVVLRPAQAASPISASVSESGTAADAPGAIGTLAASYAEAMSGADAPSAVWVTAAATAEAGTASDAPTAGTSTSAAATESGTASDAPSAGTSTSVAATEAGTAADAPAAAAASPQAVTEAGTTVDAPSAVQAASVATAEAGTVADTTSTSGAVTSGAVAEAGTASEAPSAAVATPATLSEAGTSSDAPAASLSAAGALAEAGTAVDAPAATAATGAAVVEAAAAVDAVSQISGAILTILEALAAQDTPAAQASWSSAMVEALVASDVPVSIATMTVAIVEAGVSADFIAQGATISAAVIEAGVVADAVSALRAVGDGVGEILLAADATGLSAVFVALAADSGNAADIAQATMVLAAALAEAAAAQDATDGQSGSGTSLSDTLAATDFVDWLAVAFTLLRGFAFPADSRTMEFPADVRTFDFPAAARSFDFPSNGRGHDFPETGQ